MAVFGWCMTNHHDNCPEKYQKMYIGPVGKGRKKKESPIYLDEWRECECNCHKPEEEKPKRKPAKKATPRRRKK